MPRGNKIMTFNKEDLFTYADYIIKNKTSIRKTSRELNVSEDRIYKYLTRYLEKEDSSRYAEVRKVVNINKKGTKNRSILEQKGLSNETANIIIDLLKKYVSKEKGMIYRNEVVEKLLKDTKLSKSTIISYLSMIAKDGKAEIKSVYGNLSYIYINKEDGYYK